MTLRRKLAIRYAAITGACVLLLAGLAHHEFIDEPRVRKQLGLPKPADSTWGEYAEVFFYGMIPVVFGLGWWVVRHTLNPINELAQAVERIHAGNLREALPRSGKGDEVDRLTEVFNNMTARLDQSFRQIREFTLHASHELKTPLTVMHAELESLLLAGPPLDPAQHHWVQGQLDEVQRLTRLVDSLTLLTKADAGLVALERKPVPLADLVRECFDDARILAEPDHLEVKLEACEPLEVIGDRHRLRQLLLNLIDNAVRYNQPGGRVSVALRRSDGSAEIVVSNTGTGIPVELQARVFDRFVRGPEARRRAVDGCGLGLTICQWIVQSHGGTIQLATDSARLTTALVHLPLQPA
jgi:signal transduction histidine kinase